MKTYLTANEYLHDSWRLAELIFKRGWRPDLIVALWRGGAPVGVAVHEYLKVRGWDIEHTVIKCTSYTGIGERGKVEVERLRSEVERVLFIDDVFDTGHTWERLRGEVKREARLATVYWKKPCNETNLAPDYFVHEVGAEWIVFPHELEGLTQAEFDKKDPLLTKLMV